MIHANKTIAYGTILGLLVFGGFSINDAFGEGFLKFDGIDGESQDRDHKDWSDLVSFSHQIAKTDANTNRPTLDLGFAVTKTLDKASPKIQEATLTGKLIPSMTLDLTRNLAEEKRAVYYAYELKNVQITSYSISGSGQGDVPVESFSLNFEEIKVTYTEHGPDGSKKGNVEYEWKVEKGTK